MAKTNPTEVDRRIAKTRRLLHHAFIDLVLEKGWDGIRIQDICDRANVGRTTFYAHFADKEELFLGSLSDFGAMLRESAPDATPREPLWFLPGLIRHAALTQDMFRAVVGEKAGGTIQFRFRQFLAGLVLEGLGHNGQSRGKTDPVAHFVAGGIQEAFAWWLEARAPISSEQMERSIREWCTPALESAVS